MLNDLQRHSVVPAAPAFVLAGAVVIEGGMALSSGPGGLPSPHQVTGYPQCLCA